VTEWTQYVTSGVPADLEGVVEHITPDALRCAAYLEAHVGRGNVAAEVVSNFADAQLARHVASLTSNRVKQTTAADDDLVVQNSLQALKLASAHATGGQRPLTTDELLHWHAVLGKGLLPSCGSFRTGAVRIGSQRFAPAPSVPALMARYERLMATVMHRADLLPLTKAAIAYISFVEIHPFSDGNGRIARILVNWVLLRCGYPFTVVLCCNPTQRDAYSHAVRACRAQRSFVPFAALLVGAVKAAWGELEADVAADASRRTASQVAEQLKAERAKQRSSSCMICLDEDPNVATLCCYAAVHLHCLSNWLTAAAEPTCVQCRQPMSKGPPRPAAPVRAAAPAEDETDAVEETEEDDTEDDDTAADRRARAEDETDAVDDTENDDTEDDDTEDDRRARAEDETDAVDDTQDDDTEDDDTAAAAPAARLRCSFCNNSPANGCSNDCCGACCGPHGARACVRHRSY